MPWTRWCGIEAYRKLGRSVAASRSKDAMATLSMDLVVILRQCPTPGGLAKAIEHIWGYVRKYASREESTAAMTSAREMLLHTQAHAKQQTERYLLASTALSELDV